MIAWTPLPHRRLTVNAGASFGMPALTPTTRAIYMSSGGVDDVAGDHLLDLVGL